MPDPVVSPSLTRSQERALALAGMLQACYLVTGIARSGLVGQDSMAGSLESILVTDPGNTLDVYPDGNGVRTGFRLISEIIGDLNLSEHGDTLRYAMALLGLEKKLRGQPELMAAIGEGIAEIDRYRTAHGASVDDNEVIEQISKLYEETVGRVEPRIRVLGQQKHLGNTVNTSRIRALLLAGLRSAVLWRQLGGGMAQFVLGRGRLLHACDQVAEMVN